MRRSSGLLLHPTSLPGGVIGTLGAQARAFVDFLAASGQSHWQMLPVGPGASPYMSTSAFAGNPWLIDPSGLVADGLLEPGELPLDIRGPVDFALAASESTRVLGLAVERFDDTDADYQAFCAANASWLSDFAVFSVLLERHGSTWSEWPAEDRDRGPVGLSRIDSSAVRRVRVEQYMFDRQWRRLRAYANERGVRLIGDIPIFVAHGSADVWSNRHLFELDADGRSIAVAGVPPDYFSPTGQRWGNPLYDWTAMAAEGHRWWVARFKQTFDRFDAVRVDHFRGFEAFWSIPAESETATDGEWIKGPGRAVFDATAAAMFPDGRGAHALPIIVEDLGVITDEVVALRQSLDLPGMQVLHFAFDGSPDNPHLPANQPADGRVVIYTGTHDNDTAAGWFASLSEEEQHRVRVDLSFDGSEPGWRLIECAWESRAELAVAPVQDVLGLGSEARMNVPGTVDGNWAWRMSAPMSAAHAARLREVTVRVGRG